MLLEHVNLTVADLRRSISFYQNVLGLRIRWRGLTSDGQPAAHVGDDRCYLALFQAVPPADPAETDYSKVGFNHLGFVVDDLDAVRTRLEQEGVAPHHEADYEPGVRLYFMDHDGVEVELVQYAGADESLGMSADAT